MRTETEAMDAAIDRPPFSNGSDSVCQCGCGASAPSGRRFIIGHNSRVRVVALADRFWRKVNKNGPIPLDRPELGRCWVWMGSVKPSGYGQVRGTDGRTLRAHRVAYELVVGPIPPGLQLDHLCRNRVCANPHHLEPVTQRVNILRGEAPSALAARRTHCPQGHPYDEANTILRRRTKPGRTGRECRECTIEQQAIRNERWRLRNQRGA